ncbi:MAG: hypothetical protein PHD76_13145 [Methylacidiphilales bacterium]|nr:hypothetical protein [Candidatus Methylacidiphilales bacterium]
MLKKRGLQQSLIHQIPEGSVDIFQLIQSCQCMFQLALAAPKQQWPKFLEKRGHAHAPKCSTIRTAMPTFATLA